MSPIEIEPNSTNAVGPLFGKTPVDAQVSKGFLAVSLAR